MSKITIIVGAARAQCEHDPLQQGPRCFGAGNP